MLSVGWGRGNKEESEPPQGADTMDSDSNQQDEKYCVLHQPLEEKSSRRKELWGEGSGAQCLALPPTWSW